MKVLVCNADRSEAAAIRNGLERLGHEVVESFDQQESVRRVRTEWVELVILDRSGIGLEPLRAIRAAPWSEDVPVFVLTSSPEVGEIGEAYQVGADMVLTRPFALSELLSNLRCD